jgi:hypothetical protein
MGRSSEAGTPRVRFGSKADVTLLNFDVRFTPESGHCALFDHLVGAAEQRKRYGEAKGLGGF